MISARVHYAALALVELSLRESGAGPVTIREISDRHGIPAPFLTQIMRSLRSVGWVESIRGPNGGYRLAVPSDGLTMWEIVQAMGQASESCNSGEGDSAAALASLWGQADRAAESVLRKKTLADVARQASESSFNFCI